MTDRDDGLRQENVPASTGLLGGAGPLEHLPPVRNQLAVRELVTRYRSKPVESDSMDD